jgi:hypothetical protein
LLLSGQKYFDCIGNSLDCTGSRGRLQGAANLGQVGNHLSASGGISEERAEGRGDVRGGEILLDKFRDDAAARDEVDHGDGEVAVGVWTGGPDFGGVADEAFG